MKWLYKVLAGLFFILFFIGVASMDSENLAFPIVFSSVGLFGLICSVRWLNEED